MYFCRNRLLSASRSQLLLGKGSGRSWLLIFWGNFAVYPEKLFLFFGGGGWRERIRWWILADEHKVKLISYPGNFAAFPIGLDEENLGRRFRSSTEFSYVLPIPNSQLELKKERNELSPFPFVLGSSEASLPSLPGLDEREKNKWALSPLPFAMHADIKSIASYATQQRGEINTFSSPFLTSLCSYFAE